MGYDFGGNDEVKPVHSFGDDSEVRGNVYSFEMDDGYGRANRFTLEDEDADDRGPSKVPEVRLQQLEYLQTEIDRVKSVFAEGICST